jgi:phage gp29-like protein
MADKTNPDLTIEFATDDPQVDITRGYLGNIRINEDKVLQSVGGQLSIYEDVYRDDRVKSCLQQRITAVTSRDYDVRAGGDSALDKKATEAADEMIRSLRFDRLTERFLLQSLLKGWGVGEIIWSLKGDKVNAKGRESALGRLIWPAAIKIKRSQRFTFAPLHTSKPASNRYEDVKRALRLETVLRLKTRSAPVEGEVLPPRKFIVHSVGALDDDNPFGTGLGFWLYWPVRFKREGMSLWLQFIDKFASPSAKGTYPANAGEAEKNKLLDALRALRSNSVTAVPEGMAVELIEAAKSGISTHEQLINRMDQAITTAVLSQTLTTSQGDKGSQALGTVHEGIKDGVAKSDADLLSDTLNETLMYWFAEFNFPGAVPPHIWRDMADVEDLGSKAERDYKLSQASGRNLDATYVEEQYDVKLGDAVTQPGATPSEPASFAEAAATDAADKLADQLEKDAASITDSMVDQARDLMNEVADLQEFAGRLPELLGEMDTKQLNEVMARAFTTADLTGRYEVEQGD